MSLWDASKAAEAARVAFALNEATRERNTLREAIATLAAALKQTTDNLSHTQERCTRLLEELRAAKRELGGRP